MFVRYRFVLVVALLGIAAAMLSGGDRMPLALRGLRRVLARETGGGGAARGPAVPAWRRAVAFLLVLVAFALAVLPA